MRRMASVQLQEMQITTGYINETDSKENARKKRGILSSMFRRSKIQQNDEESRNTQSKSRSRVNYRTDSILGKLKGNPKSDKSNGFDENLDPALQRALQSSLSPIPENDYSFRHSKQLIDADLERALLLSSEEHQGSRKTSKFLENNPHCLDPPERNEKRVIDHESFQDKTFLDDESIVLHEFDLTDDEEALEMALKLSLMEHKTTPFSPVNSEYTCSQVLDTDGKSLNNLKTLNSMSAGKINCDQEEIGNLVKDARTSLLSYNKSINSHCTVEQLLASQRSLDAKKEPYFDNENNFIFGGATSPLFHNGGQGDHVQNEAFRNISIPDVDANKASSNQKESEEVPNNAHDSTREMDISQCLKRKEKRHHERRYNRGKIAAKEERMLQKAIRASMRNETNASNRDLEEKELQQALKLSTEMSSSTESSKHSDVTINEIKLMQSKDRNVLIAGVIQESPSVEN